MTDGNRLANILPESECWNLMSSMSLGRLITAADGQPEVFPVNFAVQDRGVVFRTAEGTKLVSSAINRNVLFEVDDHDAAQGWSVIVRGVARILHSDEEIDVAKETGLRPWVSTDKEHYVRIRPVRVSGRRFVFDRTPSPL
ncbi:pyridoxamine 5'-phosphate oxidase family protein [Mycolicibacterium confluentis]|uniref:Pyridoxamine 5'-phosphate oxidase n=1 Tax=Mycolicibacterium confluentis TaxID=28047 RepID=A0A7I7XW61_9MYCO|nr:pyridoxamine 5'-phosphate oxidase family protein [Mycolicibacterium confluentis]MCV7321596.1 pyridoxamine 5'-phosphate oxidase family protein [Mycolicibacterium confluentis]ORV26699.1 pyridoxamine 5'-phosphate oxidase [Mycolicibacterium confluentis]BBZ33404.1 pyridoxamine 5'-phosphate oxidase [Mycolicibacterium confluentis]